MPIYEYRCADCGKRQSILFLTFGQVEERPACPTCGGHQLTRLISRTAQVLSEDSRLEAMTDRADLADVDESDPHSVARWARKMGRELGDDEMGEDLDQAVDELEDGGHDHEDGDDLDS
jgi:putative FmdB family regulatory protein